MQFKDRFKRGVDTAKFKADQLMRINRVQTEIEQLKREITSQRQKLADMALALHSSAALHQVELITLCETVGELNAQIHTRENQIANIKSETLDSLPTHASSTRQCPHCRADITEEAEFCGNCGKPTPREVVALIEKPAMRACAKCGSSIPIDIAFCPQCGNPNTKENDSSSTEG
jgi:RNA polymerase subunit RPABC4/transcription elongation factor Spt4